MNYARCVQNQGNEASLEVDVIYRVLSETEKDSGMMRVVDNEGEDYLYPSRWFELINEKDLMSELSEKLTIHLNGVSKIWIRDMANAKGMSMSSLVREWIDERLDLPEIPS